jgi:hypothetical protein
VVVDGRRKREEVEEGRRKNCVISDERLAKDGGRVNGCNHCSGLLVDAGGPAGSGGGCGCCSGEPKTADAGRILTRLVGVADCDTGFT